MTKFITKTHRYTIDNNSSAKVGETYNKQTEKKGSQAGGRGGGGKLRVPIDEQNCDGVQPKKGASAM